MHRTYSQVKLRRKLHYMLTDVTVNSSAEINDSNFHPARAYVECQISEFWTNLRVLQKMQTWASKPYMFMAVVGFEPTPPKRLEPKSSALDHSATLPAKPSVRCCLTGQASMPLVYSDAENMDLVSTRQ